MLEFEILVIEGLRAIDTSRACAVSVQEVSSLAHEIFDLQKIRSVIFNNI